MIVYTTTNKQISINRTDKKSLFDNTGTEWVRSPELDSMEKGLIGYRDSTGTHILKLTKDEMKRIINGNHAINTPTTLDELRVFSSSLPKKYQSLVDQWPDQKLREVLIEAEDRHSNPGVLLEAKIDAIFEAEEAAQRAREEEERTKSHEEAQEKPGKTRSVSRGYKNTPKKRTQEGSLSVASGDISVTLTPKQLEFLERLSECPGWKEHGTEGEYVASQYTEELEDTMTPMAVGALITTLREKGMLETRKSRMGGIKVCLFKLTPAGVQIYKELAGGRG